jgi:hypothetical protein
LLFPLGSRTFVSKGWACSTIAWLHCAPIAIRDTKVDFLEWIGAGWKLGQIQIPAP